MKRNCNKCGKQYEVEEKIIEQDGRVVEVSASMNCTSCNEKAHKLALKLREERLKASLPKSK